MVFNVVDRQGDGFGIVFGEFIFQFGCIVQFGCVYWGVIGWVGEKDYLVVINLFVEIDIVFIGGDVEIGGGIV